jgi:hypothetical protein
MEKRQQTPESSFLSVACLLRRAVAFCLRLTLNAAMLASRVTREFSIISRLSRILALDRVMQRSVLVPSFNSPVFGLKSIPEA